MSLALCVDCLSKETQAMYSVPFENESMSTEAVGWLDMRTATMMPTDNSTPNLEDLDLLIQNIQKDQRAPAKYDYEYGKTVLAARAVRLLDTNSNFLVLLKQLIHEISKWRPRFPIRVLIDYLRSNSILRNSEAIKVCVALLSLLKSNDVEKMGVSLL